MNDNPLTSLRGLRTFLSLNLMTAKIFNWISPRASHTQSAGLFGKWLDCGGSIVNLLWGGRGLVITGGLLGAWLGRIYLFCQLLSASASWPAWTMQLFLYMLLYYTILPANYGLKCEQLSCGFFKSWRFCTRDKESD